MKKRRHLKENLVTALEVPKDLAYKDTILTITGWTAAIIENYKSILKYTEEEIVLLAFHGKVTIYGSHLEIARYAPDEMQIEGKISNISFGRQ